PIGQLAEEERTEAGTPDIERRRGADLARVEGDAAALFGQPAGDAADDRHLEAVEDPDRPQPDHDHPVEAGPRQPVEAGWYVGLDRCRLRHAALDTQAAAVKTDPAVLNGEAPFVQNGAGRFVF